MGFRHCYPDGQVENGPCNVEMDCVLAYGRTELPVSLSTFRLGQNVEMATPTCLQFVHFSFTEQVVASLCASPQRLCMGGCLHKATRYPYLKYIVR